MRHALHEAWKYQGLTFPNPAVGAVVSDDAGIILGIGAHQKAGKAHAEVLALKEAYKKLTNDTRIDVLEDATQLHAFLSEHHHNMFHSLSLHVTLEPCHHHGKTPPCSRLIHALGLKRVVIGSMDESEKAKGGSSFLETKGIAIERGYLKEECDTLLTPFTCKEHHKPFVFFKLALSANRVASGGLISSEASRMMVHRLRDRCDLLVIGGNTVRVDRPRLDARLYQGKAPNVLIYSHSNDVDRTIPLFAVQGREVFVENHLERVQRHALVMVEGGQGMLDALRKEIQWYLLFHSPHHKEGTPIVLPDGLREVFSQPIGEDTMSWYVR